MVALGIALCAACSGVAGPDASLAAPGADPNAQPDATLVALGDDELIIPEVFQSHLPTTLKESALRLWVHPHLGDLSHHDYLPISTGVRYGLTKNWEISLASNLYFSHGLRNVRLFDRYGAADLQFGTKINLGQPFLPGWDTAAGIDYVFPTGRPPAELTDGLRHLKPYVTFSHRIESHRALRGLRVFWGLRLDEVTRTSVPGEFGKNSLKDNSIGATGGFVIDRNNWHYTFETSLDTTRFIGHGDRDVLTVRPGVIWEVLSRRHPLVRSNWVIGTALSSTIGPGGTSLGASLKLRYNLNLTSWWRHTPFDSGP
jgi:hypothetical protein